MTTLHTLHGALPAGPIGSAPEWIHLIPAGTFRGVDGRGPFHLRRPDQVIAASMAHGKLPLDENHATDLAGAAGQPAPARGWIVELANRDGAIWGRVEWNASGRELMADGAYRGISPVFTADRGGVVQLLMRAALTNNPNLSDLATLHTKEPAMDLAPLRAALGLPETADEAACVAAATAAGAAVTRHAAELAAIATAAGAARPESDAIVTVLNAARANAGNAERMASELVSLQTQLATLSADRARERAVACVDGAIKAGKPIPGVLRDHYVTRHMADAAGVEKELAGMPSLHAGGFPPPSRHDAEDYDGEMMTASDMEVCRKMGVDPKAMAKQRKMAREKAAAEGSAA